MLYRRIFPREYLRLSQNDRDRERIVKAEALVDFVELGRHGGGTLKDAGDIPALYSSLVRNPHEQVPWDRIERGIALHDDGNWSRIKECGYRARFHAIAALHNGRAVGLSFFKSLRMDCKGYSTGLLYGFDREFRGMGIAKALLLVSQGITLDDAEADGRPAVAGAFGDCEITGHGVPGGRNQPARTKLEMLEGLGLLPVLFDMGAGIWMTPVVQPALNPETRPLVMHMVFRPLIAGTRPKDGIYPLEKLLAAKLLSAYIRSYDALEASEQAIGYASHQMMSRFESARRVVLMRPEMVPDIETLARGDALLRMQLEGELGKGRP
jgi:hypothetical protein